MGHWLRRLLGGAGAPEPAVPEPAREAPGDPGPPAGSLAPEVLWAVVPPEGVRLLRSSPSRTGEGGQGVVAYYSDGTTASAMRNSDGSLRVLFFRGTAPLPAVALEGSGPRRFTWTDAP